ncbi:MAG: 16S rRNA (cytosine(1402)-N(4))-methyltransferase RsmH [Gammaproteobacteria bacterium]
MNEGVPTHRPVLLDAALAALAVRPAGCYVDGTFGRGGHAAAILSLLGPNGRLLAIDKDPAAVAAARARFGADPRFGIVHASFAELAELAAREGLVGAIDGLLLDLGVSSPQLDDPGRGFSFQADGPLDMRMDTSRGRSAADWLAEADEAEIAGVLRDLGEERFARRIARALVEQRAARPLRRTLELAALIERASPTRERHKHPATRTFQAIRIFVNRELDDLRQCLGQALEVLAVGARLVVISFHSLEDRIVKRFFREAAQGRQLPKGLPVTGGPVGARLRLVGKAVRADEREVAANPRARSAIMRVAEVLA